MSYWIHRIHDTHSLHRSDSECKHLDYMDEPRYYTMECGAATDGAMSLFVAWSTASVCAFVVVVLM